MIPASGDRVLRLAVRTAAKRDNRPEENEDSAGGRADSGRFAVSDGASTTARADVWSELLTDAFINGDDPLAPDVLGALRQQWWERVATPGLAWHAREKLHRGSAATFLGVRVDADGYLVTAVGDSCLLHISDGRLVLAAPLDDWTEFSRFAELVHTTPDTPVPPEHVRSASGPLSDGDILLLATDAVAKYLLRHHAETGGLPPLIEHVDDDDRFADFIERAREQQELDDDDSTVCVVWA
ncbi:protein phosphatase 2C domain-containing protein [Actinokineospora sp. PR83]|uniref:protein phosphatase 2C domain-containing protein n=1 Tax=Actinokineospora sp. PR83 TaxID=2884908 RepID=UPI0027E074D3|nr:protein phosphatase 2C domain-containing protein [Actinokineospora sp. PR83]MCG8918134.1 protein phosphatase 2C domain-containing protein [Actinokineospora sp. PR83]